MGSHSCFFLTFLQSSWSSRGGAGTMPVSPGEGGVLPAPHISAPSPLTLHSSAAPEPSLGLRTPRFESQLPRPVWSSRTEGGGRDGLGSLRVRRQRRAARDGGRASAPVPLGSCDGESLNPWFVAADMVIAAELLPRRPPSFPGRPAEGGPAGSLGNCRRRSSPACALAAFLGEERKGRTKEKARSYSCSWLPAWYLAVSSWETLGQEIIGSRFSLWQQGRRGRGCLRDAKRE